MHIILHYLKTYSSNSKNALDELVDSGTESDAQKLMSVTRALLIAQCVAFLRWRMLCLQQPLGGVFVCLFVCFYHKRFS